MIVERKRFPSSSPQPKPSHLGSEQVEDCRDYDDRLPIRRDALGKSEDNTHGRALGTFGDKGVDTNLEDNEIDSVLERMSSFKSENCLSQDGHAERTLSGYRNGAFS